jgi:hypothetical protein
MTHSEKQAETGKIGIIIPFLTNIVPYQASLIGLKIIRNFA